jgi:PAS domain S-box-containing protein
MNNGGAGIGGGLASANRRLQAVLDNASYAIFLMDDRQQCIYMNAAAEQLTGYSLEEVLALDRPLHDIIHHTHPDGSHFPLEECAIDRAFPEHNQMRGEEMFVHRQGHFYPVAFCASPVRDDASKTIGTIVEVRDITQEKRAEARQRVLIDELDHRVKNTLATVQAMARQTFSDSEPAMLTSYMNRLAAMSKAHEMLKRNAWEPTPLGDIVGSVVKTFGPDSITQSGPEIMVSPKVAVSLTMALHELATNAVKYGALSSPAGAVRISWHHLPPNDRVLELVWAESGGPVVTAPTHKGLGLRLIENQLAYEFSGRTTLDFAPGGLVCTIHLTLEPG